MATLTLNIQTTGTEKALEAVEKLNTGLKEISKTKVDFKLDKATADAYAKMGDGLKKYASMLSKVSTEAEKTARAETAHKTAIENKKTALVKLETQHEKTRTATQNLATANKNLEVQQEKTATAAKNAEAAEKNLETQQEKTRTATVRKETADKNLEIQEEKTRGAVVRATGAMREQGNAADNAGSKVSAFSKKLVDFLHSTRTLFYKRIASALYSTITSSIKDALDTMKEVDTQLTNIQKVSNMSAAEIKALGNEAYATASKYGVAADEYLSAVYTFQKAGLGDSASQLGELATKTMLVGDTTADVASKFLIASNAAWQLEGSMSALSKIVDEADYINNNYATSLDKLSTGMPIVASVAAQAGMSAEETMAALGTITSVTQESGTKAATALRALILNILGETGTYIDETGEEFKVTEESVKTLRGMMEKYAKDVLDAAKATGELVNPLEAIRAIAKAAENSDANKTEIFQILSGMGGKLRTNQLTALVENVDLLDQMLAGMGKAAGTADSEISVMLSSWESKTQILKNTWTEFVSHLIETDAIKNGLDLVTTSIDGLDTVAGKVVVSIGALAAGLMLLGPAGVIVGAVVAGLLLIIGKTLEAKKAYNEASESLHNLQKTMESQQKAVDDSILKTKGTVEVVKAYAERLDELDAQTKKTNDEQEEYHSILESLVKLVPTLSGVIDLENDTIKGGTEAILANTEAWQKNAEAQIYAAASAEIAAAKLEAEIEAKANENKMAAVKPIIDRYEELFDYISNATVDPETGLFSDEYYEKYNEWLTMLQSGEYEKAKQEYDAAEKALKEAKDAVAEANEKLTALKDLQAEAEAGLPEQKKAPKASPVKEQAEANEKAAFWAGVFAKNAEAGAEAMEEATEAANTLASSDTSVSVDTSDLDEAADDAEDAVARVGGAERKYRAHRDTLRQEMQQSGQEAVAETENMMDDVADALDDGASEAESAAKTAGGEIGRGIGDGIILQSDYIKNAISRTFSIAKSFIDGLVAAGAVSYHPSGQSWYIDRNGNKVSYAAGTTSAKGGPTLVNELGPELISENGRAYIANGGKPAVVNLKKGAVVLTASETNQALKAGGVSANSLDSIWGDNPPPATPPALPITIPNPVHLDPETGDITVDLPTPVTDGRGGGGGSGGGKKKKKKSGPNFSKLESELAKFLSEIDAKVELAENEGDWEQVVRLYEQAQEEIAKLVEAYRKAGYADDSPEIIALLNKNYDYAEKQLDVYQDRWDELISTLESQDKAEKLAKQLEEKRLAVEEARLALENAQNQRNVRVFNAQTGQWEWIANQKTIDSAQESLAKAEEAYQNEVRSQAIEELKALRDTVTDLNDVILGPALAAVATMGEDSAEFQAFARALDAVYGVGSFLASTEGSESVIPTVDSHDTTYSFGGITLTEEQASSMSLAELAQMLQVLSIT